MKRWAWITVVGTLSALMAGLVVYGVTTHKEAGLLEACVRPDRSLDYDGKCMNVIWDQHKVTFPLRAYSTGGDSFQDGVFRDAANALESELGMDTFVVVAEPNGAEVIADFSVPAEVGAHTPNGRVRHLVDPGSKQVVSATIYLSNVVLADTATNTVRHELGHVLGLAHDDFENSLMTNQGIKPNHEYPLTPDDRATLRALYAQKPK